MFNAHSSGVKRIPVIGAGGQAGEMRYKTTAAFNPLGKRKISAPPLRLRCKTTAALKLLYLWDL
jgi:hypothetical protein